MYIPGKRPFHLPCNQHKSFHRLHSVPDALATRCINPDPKLEPRLRLSLARILTLKSAKTRFFLYETSGIYSF